MASAAPAEFGRYTLLRPLGRGGMAEVYLAEVVGPGSFRKRVAVKRLLPHYAANRRFVSMMRDEAKIAAAIRHPHVAQVLDFGEVDGQHYIAMEFIDGVDLASVLRTLRSTGERLDLDAAVYIAACVAHGLHAAHTLEHAAIHRDVSPHNILVSFEGAVKLIDFGVAKATNNTTKTRSGVIKGKLQYMSPEQAQAKTVDARADVFSLGMTLYKMLTGRLPFTGQNEYQIYDQILRKKPVRPKALRGDLPLVVDAIVLKALRKDRARRFQSAGEMAAVLDHALAQLNPEYGPHELSEMLLAHIPRHSGVTPNDDPGVEGEDEDDFVSSAELVSVLSEVSGDVDEASIDRLTAIHRIGDAVLPPRGVTKREVRSAPAEDAENPEPNLARTMALPIPDLTGDDLDRRLTEAHIPSRPQPSIPPIVGRPGAVRDATPQGSERVPERLVATADMPRLTQVVTDSSVISAPSVRTEHLLAIRRRRYGVVIGLFLSGVVAGALVLALRTSEKEAQANGEPVKVSVAPGLIDAGVPLDSAVVAVRPVLVDAASIAAAPAVDAAVVVVVDAAKPAPKPKPKKVVRRRRVRGYLTVNALPWAHVEIDGRRLKRNTPIRRLPVTVGTHRVRLVSPTGQKWEKVVKVTARSEVKVVHAFE